MINELVTLLQENKVPLTVLDEGIITLPRKKTENQYGNIFLSIAVKNFDGDKWNVTWDMGFGYIDETNTLEKLQSKAKLLLDKLNKEHPSLSESHAIPIEWSMLVDRDNSDAFDVLYVSGAVGIQAPHQFIWEMICYLANLPFYSLEE